MFSKISLVVMILATLLGLLDFSVSTGKFNLNKSNLAILQNSMMKNGYLREKEEVGVHNISYSVSQRVAGRSSDI